MEEKLVATEFQLFRSSILHEGNQLALLSLPLLTLRSWSQMLFRKVQKSQQNLASRGSIAK